MICVKLVNDTLTAIDLAPDETCQFIQLAEKVDALPVSLLTPVHVMAFVGAAASCYGLVFVINSVLYTMGYKR